PCSAGGEVRVHRQPQGGETDRSHDSGPRAGAGESGDQMILRRAPERRFKFAFIACALLFALSVEVHAQQPGKSFRIGYFDPGAASLAAFRQELSKLGWIEGKNFTIEYLYKGPDRAPELATDLVRFKVDLILVSGAQPASGAKSATTTIPIVMA